MSTQPLLDGQASDAAVDSRLNDFSAFSEGGSIQHNAVAAPSCPASHGEPQYPPARLRSWNIAVMGCGFCLLFSGYNTTQSFVTSATDDLGFTDLGFHALAVLYATVCICVFAAPALLPVVGPRGGQLLGASCYVMFILSFVKIIPAVVYVSSVIIGFGASILWIAQGAFLTANSTPDDRGRNAGFFWAAFQASGLIGNGGAYFLTNTLKGPLNYALLFTVLAAAAGAGAVVLALQRRLPDPTLMRKQTAAWDDIGGIKPPTVKFSASALVVCCVRMMARVDILLLTALFFFSGFELSFFSGEFPLLLRSDQIPAAMLAFACGEVVGALSVGKLSDILPQGKRVMLVVGNVSFGIALVLCWVLKTQVSSTAFLEFAKFAAAACLGFADASFNTIIYSTIGKIFGDEVPDQKKQESNSDTTTNAFTLFQFWQNLGSAVGFYYSPLVPFHGSSGTDVQLFVLASLALISLATYFVLKT